MSIPLSDLLDATSPAPWDYRSTSNPKMDDSDADKPVWRINTYWPDGRINSGPGFTRADAEFICAARTKMPKILAQLKVYDAALTDIGECTGCDADRASGIACDAMDKIDRIELEMN